MRPPGVQQRVRELLDAEWDRIHARPELRLRVDLTAFVSLAARQWYADHPVTTVLRRYHEVLRRVADPAQLRTGTAFEAAALECVELLRPDLGEPAARPAEEVSFEEQEHLREPLLRVPPLTMLGEVNPDCYYHLVCWNHANSLLEGVQTPYRAARLIANEGFHTPADPYGLLPPLTALAVRYEDRPDERVATAQEIVELLADYVTRVPWASRRASGTG